MRIKALILDLDNTIYPVPSIGDRLFKDLFTLIENSGAYKGDLEMIKADIMRRPMQWVAKEYQFSEQLTRECLDLLENLTYDGPIEAFPDYAYVRKLPCKKYLVTTGFAKMQHSKIDGLGIRDDFEEIVVVDPSVSTLTKKDIFQKILRDHHYHPKEVVVIGDDPKSELQAAIELGIEAVQYKHLGGLVENINTISDFRQLEEYLD